MNTEPKPDEVCYQINVLWGRALTQRTPSGDYVPKGVPTTATALTFYTRDGEMRCRIDRHHLFADIRAHTDDVLIGPDRGRDRESVLRALWQSDRLDAIGHDHFIGFVYRAIFFGRTQAVGPEDTHTVGPQNPINRLGWSTKDPSHDGDGDFSPRSARRESAIRFGTPPAHRALDSTDGRW